MSLAPTAAETIELEYESACRLFFSFLQTSPDRDPPPRVVPAGRGPSGPLYQLVDPSTLAAKPTGGGADALKAFHNSGRGMGPKMTLDQAQKCAIRTSPDSDLGRAMTATETALSEIGSALNTAGITGFRRGFAFDFVSSRFVARDYLTEQTMAKAGDESAYISRLVEWAASALVVAGGMVDSYERRIADAEIADVAAAATKAP